MKGRDIILTLFREHELGLRNQSDPRVKVLRDIVLDLMMEVNALRDTCWRLSELSSEPRTYAESYRASALLTHNAAGPSSGTEKLIERFYARDPTSSVKNLRELSFMAELGFSDPEIRGYVSDASTAETFT